jgi:hypothetical protein
MIVRKAFPQIYEYDHPKSGRYWLVSARRPKWSLNERKTFSVKKLAEEYADGIEEPFLDSGRQVEIPKEKVVMVKSYEQLAEKVGNYGVSVEEAIDHFMRYKGDEIVRGAKASGYGDGIRTKGTRAWCIGCGARPARGASPPS